MLDEVTSKDEQDDDGNPVPPEESMVLERSEVIEDQRDDMQIAWRRTNFIDANENREAFSYTLVARRWNIMPLITFAYWADDAAWVEHAWQEMLRTLTLGDYVEDPTQRLTDV